jgi:hypothetical protein
MIRLINKIKTLFEIVIFNTRQNNIYYIGIFLMTIGMILISTSKQIESNEKNIIEPHLEKNKTE